MLIQNTKISKAINYAANSGTNITSKDIIMFAIKSE